MKVEALKENLHRPLSLVSRYISSRPALPILANTLLEATNQGLILSSTNLDVTVKVLIPSQVEETGQITAPAKPMYELINTLPSGKITLSSTDTQLIMTSQANTSAFNTITAEDFPVLPKFNSQNALALPLKDLQQVAEKILFAASADESRPILTTILLKQIDQNMVFVTTDGYRLSEVTHPVSGSQLEPDRLLLLPAKIIAELLKIGSDNKADTLWIDITTQTNQLAMKVAEVEFFSKLINGNFPPYEKIIPTDFLTEIELQSDAFQQAVRLASVFARDAGSLVRLHIKPESSQMIIEAQSASLGQNQSTIDISGAGPEITISFNSKFLLDILTVLSDGTIQLKLKNPDAPMMVVSPTQPEFRHIIMPLKS